MTISTQTDYCDLLDRKVVLGYILQARGHNSVVIVAVFKLHLQIGMILQLNRNAGMHLVATP